MLNLRYRKELELSLQGFYTTCECNNPRCVGIEKKLAQLMEKRLSAKPELIKTLLPNYPPLCKRLTPDPVYLEALALPIVDVITSHIRSIDTTGIITRDGRHRPVDTIIYVRQGWTLRSLLDFPYSARMARIFDISTVCIHEPTWASVPTAFLTSSKLWGRTRFMAPAVCCSCLSLFTFTLRKF